MLKGLPTRLRGRHRERRSNELLRLYLIERSKPGNESLPKVEICHRIVMMPAPEFYINSRAAHEIIKEQRNLRIKTIGRCEK